jgi:hypothetical protein
MKYVFMIIVFGLLIITSVWQNIEVMKLKMEYRRLVQDEQKLIKKNDILRYKIATQSRMSVMDQRAKENGYRSMKPGDVNLLYVKKRKGK